MVIKNNLKQIRMREYMLSSKDFAKLLDAPVSTYSQWENGTNNPTLAKSFEIAKKINKSVIDIWYSE